eukprot:351875-Chlamydomonas_euryale.AAC.3
MWTSPDQALEPGGEFCVPTLEPGPAGGHCFTVQGGRCSGHAGLCFTKAAAPKAACGAETAPPPLSGWRVPCSPSQACQEFGP